MAVLEDVIQLPSFVGSHDFDVDTGNKSRDLTIAKIDVTDVLVLTFIASLNVAYPDLSQKNISVSIGIGNGKEGYTEATYRLNKLKNVQLNLDAALNDLVYLRHTYEYEFVSNCVISHVDTYRGHYPLIKVSK